MYDHVTHAPNTESYKTLPEVILSGALHGNERVGPTAVLEAIELLVESAACEALPGPGPPPGVNGLDYTIDEAVLWNLQVDQATTFRQELLQTRGLEYMNR